jgi:hypothetical protein
VVAGTKFVQISQGTEGGVEATSRDRCWCQEMGSEVNGEVNELEKSGGGHGVDRQCSF